MSSVVLVLTHWFDPTADLVIDVLNDRGVPVVRCDPGAFPTEVRLSATLGGGHWTGGLHVRGRSIALEDIGCAYYRRPTTFRFLAGMSGPELDWAMREARAGFGGVISALPRWLNHPRDIAYAEHKPVQLAAAAACGLAVPSTLITNNARSAATFMGANPEVIYKPLSSTMIAEEAVTKVIYTEVLSLPADLTGVHLTAHLFQEKIEGGGEVRLAVVDDQCFAALIHPDGVDWRRDQTDLTFTPVATPPDVQEAMSRLMKVLNLRYGAADFIVTPDGDWVFLEVNPNGQFAFVDDHTTQEITAAIADALTKEAP